MQTQNYYKTLKPHLPKEIFSPAPGRMIYFFLLMTLGVTSIYFILSLDLIVYKLIFSLSFGYTIGGLTFLGHEILHGSVLKNNFLKLFFGGICFMPWGLIPQAWVKWHNTHHNFTNHDRKDPDCYGNVERFSKQKFVKYYWKVSPGSGTILSLFFFPAYFSFKCFGTVFLERHFFSSKAEKIIYRTYMFLCYSFWIGFSISFGWQYFFWLFFIPLGIGNVLWISHIFTNHFISPQSNEINDPLQNSLSVTYPYILRKLCLNFCYHTEHHVFPSMNPKYAPILSSALKKLWPKKYKEMNFFLAIKYIFSSPRFYKSKYILMDPVNNKIFDVRKTK